MAVPTITMTATTAQNIGSLVKRIILSPKIILSTAGQSASTHHSAPYLICSLKNCLAYRNSDLVMVEGE